MPIEPQNPEVNFYPIAGLDSVTPTIASPDNPQPNSQPTPLSPTNVVSNGGDATLIGGTFQSPNFVKGKAGWQLDSNGNIEGNNGNFRGDITGASGTFSGTLTGGSLNIPDTTTANSFHVDTAGLAWSGANVANKATAPVRINPTGEMTLGDPTGTHLQFSGPNVRVRSSNYSAGSIGFNIDTGLIESNNILARGEFRNQVLSYGVVHTDAGSRIMSKSAGSLKNDVTSVTSPTTFNVDVNDPPTGHTQLFAVSDILRIKDGSGNDNWMTISSVSDQTTFFRYVCTKNNGSNATFRAGAAVVNYGASGQAFIYETVDDSNAPFYSIRTHAGSPWTTTTEIIRIGNLNGNGSFVSTTYGIAIGDSSTTNFLTYDTVSGNLIVNGTRLSGQTTFGDGSDGAVTISADTTLTRDMYYTTLVVNAGKTLTPGGFKIFCQTSCTINATGKIDYSGNAGGAGDNAQGGTFAGGAAGAALASGTLYGSVAGQIGGAGQIGQGSNGVNGTNVTDCVGSAGKDGGSGGGAQNPPGTSTGGTGGTITAAVAAPRNIVEAVIMRNSTGSTHNLFVPQGGAGSGGGGSGDNATRSGGGGGGSASGGGVIAIYAKTLINNGTISANGANGGKGGDGRTIAPFTGAGGGGAGSNGGFIYLVYNSKSGSGTITVTQGTGGAKGTLSGGPAQTEASAGQNGTAGTIIEETT